MARKRAGSDEDESNENIQEEIEEENQENEMQLPFLQKPHRQQLYNCNFMPISSQTAQYNFFQFKKELPTLVYETEDSIPGSSRPFLQTLKQQNKIEEVVDVTPQDHFCAKIIHAVLRLPYVVGQSYKKLSYVTSLYDNSFIIVNVELDAEPQVFENKVGVVQYCQFYFGQQSPKMDAFLQRRNYTFVQDFQGIRKLLTQDSFTVVDPLLKEFADTQDLQDLPILGLEDIQDLDLAVQVYSKVRNHQFVSLISREILTNPNFTNLIDESQADVLQFVRKNNFTFKIRKPGQLQNAFDPRQPLLVPKGVERCLNGQKIAKHGDFLTFKTETIFKLFVAQNGGIYEKNPEKADITICENVQTKAAQKFAHGMDLEEFFEYIQELSLQIMGDGYRQIELAVLEPKYQSIKIQQFAPLPNPKQSPEQSTEVVVPAGMVPKGRPKLFDGQNVVRTGTLSLMTEKQLDDFLRYYGAKVSSSINQSTVFVVEGSRPGANKLAEASSKGVEVLSESQFYQRIVQLSDCNAKFVPFEQFQSAKISESDVVGAVPVSTGSKAEQNQEASALPGATAGVPAGLVPVGRRGALKNLPIVRTGALFCMTEKELDQFLQFYGTSVGSAVNAKTFCVIEGEKPGAGKLGQAAKFGVQVVSEPQFYQKILELSGGTVEWVPFTQFASKAK